MSDFRNKIDRFFKYKFEEIFGIIAILGFGISMICLVIDLIFGTEWAIYFLMGFFFLFIASIFVTLIMGVVIYYIYEIFISWWYKIS